MPDSNPVTVLMDNRKKREKQNLLVDFYKQNDVFDFVGRRCGVAPLKGRCLHSSVVSATSAIDF